MIKKRRQEGGGANKEEEARTDGHPGKDAEDWKVSC